jgi:arginase
MRVQVVSVPYRYDELNAGSGAGPAALISAGLEESIRNAGLEFEGVRIAELAAAEREAGKTGVNIGKLGASTAALIAEACREGTGCLVLAGDDTACVGVVSGLQRAHGADARIGVLWCDAHGDFNTPETSYSGILAGMPLAVIAGLAGPNWRVAADMGSPIPTERILLAGVRDLDQKEEELLRATSAQIVSTSEYRDGRFQEALDRLLDRSDFLFLHVDLDLLDPELMPSLSTPAAGGLSLDEASEMLSAALATGKVIAWSICSLNPGGGARGQRSVATARRLIEQALPSWR